METSESDRVELAKLLKVFQLITLLKASKWKTKQLMEQTEMSRASIFRYLKLLAGVGFCIEQDKKYRYQIVTSDTDPMDLKLSFDELQRMRGFLMSDMNDPLNNALLKKLSLLSDLDAIPAMFHKAHLGKLIEQLSLAMRNKLQISLDKYHSANSDTITNRLVEPVHFCEGQSSIIAFELESKKSKQFKIDRIGGITETRNHFEYAELHEKKTIDAFGITGKPEIIIILKLKTRAYLILKEHYPMTIPYITEQDGEYIFEGPVVNYNGIGSFVMSLPREIDVVGPPAFDDYIIQEAVEMLKRKKSMVIGD